MVRSKMYVLFRYFWPMKITLLSRYLVYMQILRMHVSWIQVGNGPSHAHPQYHLLLHLGTYFFCLQFLFELYFFRERNYTLQPTDYIIGPASGNPDLCLTWPRALPPNSDGIDWQMGNFFIFLVSTDRH